MNIREGVKTLSRMVATVMVIPSICTFHIRSWLVGPDRAIEAATQTLSLIPGLTGQYLRQAFLARVIAHCSSKVTIEFGTIFSAVGTRIDDGVYIGPRCHIGLAHLERDVLIGAAVHVPSGRSTHGTSDPDTPIRDQPRNHQLVHIGEGVWIGSAAVVMADVGRETIVGAGAVVTRPLPARVVAGGVPARILYSRDRPTAGESSLS